MDLINDIKPITYLKTRAADVLKQINETRKPMIITQNGEAKAVLQDPKSYEEMQNAFTLLKLLSQSEANIAVKEYSPQSEIFDRIENNIKKRFEDES